ncbi:thioredoxin [bacterium]|nr:thioredoxin [bacterium]
MSKIVEVTDENFEEEVLNSDLPTEVDFWAPWCGPCRMVIPIYEKLAEEYYGKFKFCMINVDENQRTARKFQIMSIPMQKFFVNGEEVDEILGAVPENNIRAMVDDILKRFPSSEMGRLLVLLISWIESNKQSNAKLNKWFEQTEAKGSDPLLDQVKQIAGEINKANESLSRVLVELQKEK